MKQVLIMEDNTALAIEWREVFELNDIKVEITHSAEEAVALLDKQEFDLVITDLFVSGNKGGLYVLAKLISMHKKAPPAIAVTGSFARGGSTNGRDDGNLFLTQARKLGSAETIQKPFAPIELVVLARALWEKESE